MTLGRQAPAPSCCSLSVRSVQAKQAQNTEAGAILSGPALRARDGMGPWNTDPGNRLPLHPARVLNVLSVRTNHALRGTMPPPFMPQRVVLVVRDPDWSNVIQCYDEDGKPDNQTKVIDVDLGKDDLSNPDEYGEWVKTQLHVINELPPGHPVKLEVISIIDQEREKHGHPLPTSYYEGEARFDQLEQENGDPISDAEWYRRKFAATQEDGS